MIFFQFFWRQEWNGWQQAAVSGIIHFYYLYIHHKYLHFIKSFLHYIQSWRLCTGWPAESNCFVQAAVLIMTVCWLARRRRAHRACAAFLCSAEGNKWNHQACVRGWLVALLCWWTEEEVGWSYNRSLSLGGGGSGGSPSPCGVAGPSASVKELVERVLMRRGARRRWLLGVHGSVTWARWEGATVALSSSASANHGGICTWARASRSGMKAGFTIPPVDITFRLWERW